MSLNLYTYCQNNPVSFIDSSGHERIVVSGGIDGEEAFPYQFVETALKQVSEWRADSWGLGIYGVLDRRPPIPENDITWIVADWNYQEYQLRSFRNVALKHNINFMTISDKQELFDYIRACLKNPYIRQNAHKSLPASSKILAGRQPAYGFSPSIQ